MNYTKNEKHLTLVHTFAYIIQNQLKCKEPHLIMLGRNYFDKPTHRMSYLQIMRISTKQSAWQCNMQYLKSFPCKTNY